jgi:transposase-like protein
MKYIQDDWTPDQKKAIELLAAGGMKYIDIAKECNVSEHTLYDWRKDARFMDLVIARARELLKESLPSVYSSLTTGAQSGDARHIKLVLEHLEKLEEIKARYADSIITFTWEPPYGTDNS